MTLQNKLTTLRDNLNGSSIFTVPPGHYFYHGGRPLNQLSPGHPLWATITQAGANLHGLARSEFTTVTKVSARGGLKLLDIGSNTLITAYEALKMESLEEYEALLTSYCDLIRIDGILCRGENVFIAHQEQLKITH